MRGKNIIMIETVKKASIFITLGLLLVLAPEVFAHDFWIDRKEALYGLMMLQHQPNAYYPIAQQFKALTYQALIEVE